jgi:hypothetical protein
VVNKVHILKCCKSYVGHYLRKARRDCEEAVID